MIKLYLVFDTQAEIYAKLFPERTDASAMRVFAAAIADPETPLHVAPSDYILFRIGQYSEDTGVLEAETAPVRIFDGNSAVLALHAAQTKKELDNGQA